MTQVRDQVGRRMVLAIALISALPLCVASLGWLAGSLVEAPVESATEKNLQFADERRRAADLSRRLFDLLVDPVTNSADIGEQERDAREYLIALNLVAPQLDSRALAADYDGVPDQPAYSFVNLMTDIAAHAETLLAARTEVAEAEQLLIARKRHIAERIVQLEQRSRAVQGADPEMLAFRANARRLSAIVDSLQLGFAVEIVAEGQARFAAVVREMVFQATNLADPVARESLSAPLRELFGLALSVETDSAFAVAGRGTAAQLAMRKGQRELQRIEDQFDGALAAVDLANTARLRATVNEANEVIRLTRAGLILASVLSALIALAVAQFYVRGYLLRRFGDLQRESHRLAAGQVDEPVVVSGSDAIARVATNLESLRQVAERQLHDQATLQSRNAELEAVRADLQRFAYVASHDLRAPLRAVQNLAGFLQEDLSGKVPDESLHHVALISARVGRLDELLASLLEYSRAAGEEPAPEVFDVSEFLHDCARLALDQRFLTEIDGEPLRVRTARSPLEQVVGCTR